MYNKYPELEQSSFESIQGEDHNWEDFDLILLRNELAEQKNLVSKLKLEQARLKDEQKKLAELEAGKQRQAQEAKEFKVKVITKFNEFKTTSKDIIAKGSDNVVEYLNKRDEVYKASTLHFFEASIKAENVKGALPEEKEHNINFISEHYYQTHYEEGNMFKVLGEAGIVEKLVKNCTQ